MKKLLILSTCAIATIATAETFKGVSSDRTLIGAGTSTENALILDSSEGIRYSGESKVTYRSVSVENGTAAGGFNMAYGGLTLDANTTDESFDILTAGDWTMNHTYLILKNSAENSKSKLNVTVYKFAFDSKSQNQSLTFESGDFVVKTSARSTFSTQDVNNYANLNINSGASVKWSGGALVMGSNSFVDLSGTLETSSTLTCSSGSTFTVNSGGYLLKSSGSMNINSGATLNVMAGAGYDFKAGTAFNLDGTFNVATAITLYKGTSTGKFVQTAGSLTFARPFELSSGSNWSAFEKVFLAGGTHPTDMSATEAKLTLNEGATFVIKNNTGRDARVLFSGYNNLVLNKENAIVDEEGKTVKLATVAQYKDVKNDEGEEEKVAVDVINNKMTVNASQSFRSLYLGEKSSLDIIMAEDVMLSFTDSTSFNTAADTAYLNVFNFQENTISFNNVNSTVLSKIEKYVRLYGATEDDFLGFATLSNNGFLTLAAIPEPAEWAMLLGALALGLAVYRKRR